MLKELGRFFGELVSGGPPIIEPVAGRCCLCEQYRNVNYCERCKHWFCADCRGSWMWRVAGFIETLTCGRGPGCCGPEVRI